MRRVPGRVPWRRYRGNAWHEFFALLMTGDLVADHAEDTFDVAHLGARDLGKLACIAVVGPERPFLFGYHDFGVGECRLVVCADQAVDVVTVEVRDEHHID